MPVFRVDKSRDFTVVANCVFKDRSLSAKAKGILVEMLSLPESWDYTLKGLTSLFSDGIDSIRQGINELEKHGYIVRERKRDARGRLGGMEYVIYETPHIVREEDQTSQSVENFAPESPEPTTEKPMQDSSAEEMPTVYKEINKYNKNKSMTFEINKNSWKNVRLWKTRTAVRLDGKKFRTLRERERRSNGRLSMTLWFSVASLRSLMSWSRSCLKCG